MRYWLTGIVAAGVIAALVVWFFHSQESPVPRIGKSRQDRVIKSDQEWRALLTPEQYRVTRRKETERRFTVASWNAKADGVFQCVCCGEPLFDAKTKYDSGTGWPSFWQPIEEDNVSLVADDSPWMRRTEVICSRCDAHLGHVFTDGPPPTGLRYCINSAALKWSQRAEGARQD